MGCQREGSQAASHSSPASVSLSGTMWARAHRASWGSATGHNVSASVAVDCRRPRQPGQDHSVTEGEWVEPRECGLLDPAEELDQLVEEGQRRRSCWVKPQNQQTEDQGGQEALFEGLREEVALHRAPKLAKQPQQ